MPNRIIKESINESRGLANCSFFAQDLYKRLITYADDYGRFNADPVIILARLYPRELDVVTMNMLMDGLIELTGVGKIGFYLGADIHDKKVYGVFPNWGEHQRLRDSKKKMPEPFDTRINDWYLRRFVSVEKKIAIIERDGFKCQICGKLLWAGNDAKLFVKSGAGLFHIDHEVPVCQGGRATMENLRLTCPECSQSQKKRFSFDEILQFAASCRELPRVAENCENAPPESNPNPKRKEEEEEYTAAADNPFGEVDDSRPNFNTVEVYAANQLGLTPGNMQEFEKYKAELSDDLIRHAIDEAGASRARTWKYVRSILNRYIDDGIKTVEDAKAAETERQKAKERSQPTKQEQKESVLFGKFY